VDNIINDLITKNFLNKFIPQTSIPEKMSKVLADCGKNNSRCVSAI
jgi:hypothetical protein